GRARNENVAGQKQHRQSIDVRERRRRDEVGGSRADRRRARHHSTPHVGFGKRDRSVRHRLLVVRTIRWHLFAHGVERFADARDIAVTENREDAAEQRLAVFVPAQRREIANERLRCSQSNRFSHWTPTRTFGSTPCARRQASISASKLARIARFSSASSNLS